MIVVADASPLRYLILIEHTHILPLLYGHVHVPSAVVTELTQEHTPALVQEWMASRPDWVHVQDPTGAIRPAAGRLKQTNFRGSEQLFQSLLAGDAARRQTP